ncbi:MAG: TIGR03943 family protein [Anaerolineaceae bacterium]|nr:TIGR03943 family protein [Anaerolineaceae bacterium]
MKRKAADYTQALITFAMAFYLSQKLANGQLAYYIHQRFFWLSFFSVLVLLILNTIQVKSLLSPLLSEESAKKGASLILKLWPWLNFLPVICNLFKLPLSFAGSLGILYIAITGLMARKAQSLVHTLSPKHAAPAGVLAILSIPLLLGFLVPAQPLSGAAAASKEQNAQASAGINAPVQLPVTLQHNDLNVYEWSRVFSYESDLSAYLGKEANVIGFVYRNTKIGPNQFMVGRVVVTCCVADAFTVGMVVDWPNAAEISNDAWVKVKGSIDIQKVDSYKIPLIHAQSVEIITAPQQPYLYP